ncbi:cysteine proteinase [Eremomyces bilateralis CBS 781.70]|uniref:ubiquitinyl hydrolase 1 n=1 Tax=Eremomyces bilateralis CBS 781.70 TaxID=1392243 RepID=A0A6G1GI38_9PEZI|nr:cysteine proteinase [Eremomyces bilateralis CBS 781.70]KAF1817642.1 cysteine proteinase [Eremomyces bilateralis CBS 781.70]
MATGTQYDNTINVDELLLPATQKEKDGWTGWVKLQGEPWAFNALMRHFGLANLRWIQATALDYNGFIDSQALPDGTRLYAMIVVGRPYWALDKGQRPYHRPGIWFANQLITDACGTIALMKVLGNLPDGLIDSEQMAEFFATTESHNQVQRGEDITGFEDLRSAHNACARKMEMFMQDAKVITGYTPNARKGRPGPKSLGETSNVPPGEINLTQGTLEHFVAYSPIGNQLWYLNGLDEWPR